MRGYPPHFGGETYHWYRWLVNFRNDTGKIEQMVVEATTHAAAIMAGKVSRPDGRDFAAIRQTGVPL